MFFFPNLVTHQSINATCDEVLRTVGFEGLKVKKNPKKGSLKPIFKIRIPTQTQMQFFFGGAEIEGLRRPNRFRDLQSISRFGVMHFYRQPA